MTFFSARGQSFAVLELLVASIMALALLAIIVGLIYYFDSLATEASFRAFHDAVLSGVNSPNGDIIRADDIILPPSILTNTSIANMAGIPNECMALQAPGDSEIIPKPDASYPTAIEIQKRLRTTIYIRCVLGSALSPVSGDCEKSCVVSFGRPIVVDN